jgi:NADPH:quinone reductase-like Zn-dependent oxidoreductase
VPIDEALWYRRFGPPVEALTLETAELGPRRPGTVRVRMIAAPINPSDLVPITGAYAHRVQPPRVAGYEGVGRVVEADAAFARLAGRRVLPLRGPGTWRRYADCDPAWLVEVPDDVETTVAARAYINPLAAFLMLRSWPVDGRRVLLTGGGSSCARLLGRWAIEAGAREVVAVHRSDAHAASLAGLGLVPLSMANPGAIAAAASGADLAFDAVGGALAESLLAALPRRSDFVSYGLLSGEPFRPPPAGPNVRRFHLRDRLADVEPSEWQGWFRDLWPKLRRTPTPEARLYPLADWRQALAAFDQPGRRFKPMLAMNDTQE